MLFPFIPYAAIMGSQLQIRYEKNSSPPTEKFLRSCLSETFASKFEHGFRMHIYGTRRGFLQLSTDVPCEILKLLPILQLIVAHCKLKAC